MSNQKDEKKSIAIVGPAGAGKTEMFNTCAAQMTGTPASEDRSPVVMNTFDNEDYKRVLSEDPAFMRRFEHAPLIPQKPLTDEQKLELVKIQIASGKYSFGQGISEEKIMAEIRNPENNTPDNGMRGILINLTQKGLLIKNKNTPPAPG